VLQYGQMEIINHAHGVKCVVNFKPCGWFGREANKIEATIYNKKYEISSLFTPESSISSIRTVLTRGPVRDV
jgi:hypothetical protein